MKKSLNEELKRHMQIINYANDLDKVIEEKFKVTFQEQEPETEPEGVEDEVETETVPPTPPTPPTPGATPPTPTAGTPKAQTGGKNLPAKPDLSGGNRPVPPAPPAPPAPTPGATPPAPPAPEKDVDEDVEEIDVTDLVNNTEEVGDTVDKFAKQLSDIESKFSELSGQLSRMDTVFQKIDSIEMEIEKMVPPTPVERMELRSLDSFPYNQRLDDYFEQKKGEYKRLRGVDLEVQPELEKEYTLTVGDTEEWDDNSIGKSFNPDYDENN